MSQNNPEIESQLDALTQQCINTLEGEGPVVNEQSEALCRALLMSGYARTAETSLQAELEKRVRDLAPRRTMNRGEEVAGVTRQLHEKFEHMKLWESKKPEGYPPAKSANISSATDS
jgi:hypothetical protein